MRKHRREKYIRQGMGMEEGGEGRENREESRASMNDLADEMDFARDGKQNIYLRSKRI